MTSPRPRIAVALLALAVAGAAWGQAAPHPVAPSGLSSLPAGDGVLRGVIVDAESPGATGDLTVALYALQPDGTPGVGSTRTAADGSFEFTGVSSDPAIVYLVGVRYELVPYGERTAFVPGQPVVDLMLPVKRPTTDASGVEVLESSLRIESRGTRLTVEETHRLTSAGARPVYVPEGGRSGTPAPFRTSLPAGALDFQAGVFNATEGFEQDGDALRYWGPIYEGEQELRYAYQLAIPNGASVVGLTRRFPQGTGRVRVLTPEPGPRVESSDLVAGTPVDVDGRKLAVHESGAREPGSTVRLAVHVPETSSDPSQLSLGLAELAIELDDTVLEVTHSQRIEVAEGAHLAGRPGSPLLRFDLPVQAELVGLSTDAQQLGVSAVDGPVDRAIEVYGPLGPGSHDVAFRYRLPASGGSARLDLQFPLTVPSLLLRAADTGLLIESDRLHRLRPQAIGTRTWMLREAFHVEPDEVVSVRFEALDQSGPSQLAGVFFVVVASAFVLLFVVGPLRQSRRVARAESEDRAGLAHERDLVYATIRDLDHDFETGKLAEDDYQRIRSELRARAVELMRQEKQAARAVAPVARAAAAAAPGAHALPTGRFCPACGGAVDADWRFCSHCGGTLAPAPASGATGSEPAG